MRFNPSKFKEKVKVFILSFKKFVVKDIDNTDEDLSDWFPVPIIPLVMVFFSFFILMFVILPLDTADRNNNQIAATKLQYKINHKIFLVRIHKIELDIKKSRE